MADSNRLAEVVAMLAERDQEFAPIERAAKGVNDETGEPYWPLSELMQALDVDQPKKVTDALNRAKIAAAKSELTLSEHFANGTIFDDSGEVYLSKYAAYLVVMNCDPEIGKVGRGSGLFCSPSRSSAA